MPVTRFALECLDTVGKSCSTATGKLLHFHMVHQRPAVASSDDPCLGPLGAGPIRFNVAPSTISTRSAPPG
jgi:hypothetical protein